MSIAFEIYIAVAIMQFLCGLAVWGWIAVEAHQNYLTSTERRNMRIACIATLTAPLSIFVIPIAILLFVLYYGLMLVKVTRTHWSHDPKTSEV